jgi:integrase/recombinase XerD
VQEADLPLDKSGRVHVVGSVPLLHPEAQTVEEMLEGWRNQQMCRNLGHDTIAGRVRLVERFVEHTNEFPWMWTPALVEEFFGDLRSVKRCKQSTVRRYQNALRLFCSYVSVPDYGWDRVCEQRFGTHPAQVFFDWNTAVHVQDNEQSPTKRAFTKRELQDFFDHADDQVASIAASARKGWLPAYRDATMFKLAYSYGLRFNELRDLQTVDFTRNAHAREFGGHGVVQVRYGKAKKGSPPKRRGVLTVFKWTPEVITDWLAHGQPAMTDGLDLFPSERGALVAENTLLRRFRRYCRDLELPDGLDLHSLRRSYATHLIEDGWDARFVQDQMGHDHASGRRCIPACPATTGSARCAGCWTPQSTPRCRSGRKAHETASRLHLAVGRADGRSWDAQQYRSHSPSCRAGNRAFTATGVSRGSPTPRTGFASNDRRPLRYLGLRRRGPDHRDRGRCAPTQSVGQLAGHAQAQRGRAQQSGASASSQGDQR